MDDWHFILEINWHPIFELAHTSLCQISAPHNQRALDILRAEAETIALSQVIRRHDVAGRIFHRLLASRKFLATNYTTVPAAVLLSGLAFGSEHGPLRGKSLLDEEALATDLRIVDPACGSGTLLMAALQDVRNACHRKRHAAAVSGASQVNLKPILEQSLFGFDVVPGARHLTNTTLSMSETTQVLDGLPIYVMPHDCDPQSGTPRLGSLDFLKRAPNHNTTTAMELFPAVGAASRVTGAGEERLDLHLPGKVDLFICNPPYTRAGGPGDQDHTAWNPLFGSVLSTSDADTMQQALKKTLNTTIGSLYAGLGSAFVALIDQEAIQGATVALVLPLTAVTGSRWQKVRERLLSGYQIEWVVTSHDDRNRTKKEGLPGRRWVSFSESTRIAEVLIVAVRRDKPDPANPVKFVNLRHNPDEPADAIALTRALLNSPAGNPVSGQTSLLRLKIPCPHPTADYGEIVTVPQSKLDGGAWHQVVFTQAALTDSVMEMLAQDGPLSVPVPVTPLGTIADLGPYHMQIKGKGGLFDCEEAAPGTLDIPAMWHHSHVCLTTLGTDPNAVLTRRPNRQTEQDRMLERAGRLHLAAELGHAPQRFAATMTTRKALGVSSWITLLPKQPRPGAEEALCLWLNGTLGLVLRIAHANRPYLGRSRVHHELAQTMPVLDVTRLADHRLLAAEALFSGLAGRELQGFANIATDPVRCELNERFVTEVLGGTSADVARVGDLTAALAQEPLMTTRH